MSRGARRRSWSRRRFRGLPGRGATASQSKNSAGQLVGAGSTFVQPLVSQWQAAYPSVTGVNIVYQPIGSGGGIQAITNRTVDFGASDAPLTPDQIDRVQGLPADSVGARRHVGHGERKTNANAPLHITGPVLARIYLGQITNWDDPAIKALNPGISLPNEKITPVYRSDGSGTSYNFTDYLSSVSPASSRRSASRRSRRSRSASAAEARPASPVSSRAPRRDRLRRHRVRGDEPHPGDGGQERGRHVHDARHQVDHGRRGSVARSARTTRCTS